MMITIFGIIGGGFLGLLSAIHCIHIMTARLSQSLNTSILKENNITTETYQQC